MKHQKLIEKMTREEKASLCSGRDCWHFKGIERLDIPDIMVSDGPHGLRKQGDEKMDNMGINSSYPATCFPPAVTAACSWDRELIYKMGEALGEECLKEKVSILLGPGVNIKRSPLCGRNFEYFSEDPYLAGQLGEAWVKGVQSKGVGTSLKHFAANNQETRRFTVSSVVDERTLREIYLPAFENVVKKAQPWTVMNAYNRLNGEYCAECKKLLTDILKNEWGHEGIVITDWGAENEIVDGIKAGQQIEMPSSNGIAERRILKALEDGTLDESVLDESVDRILDIIFRAKETLDKGDFSFSAEEHDALARKIADESMVLLKNENSILPLDREKNYAVIGELAVSPRYQGAGSSKINPLKLDNALDALLEAGVKCEFAKGYDKNKSSSLDDRLIGEACRIAKKSAAAIIFVGLTDDYESEGYDRTSMKLPAAHNELINAVYAVNKNIIVVLSCGSPVEMPWISKAQALLNSYLGGQAGGHAVADILTGKVNPSGKLAETFPVCLEDNPTYKTFPGSTITSEYREGLYVGYRYYDTVEKDVLFPFGYGLSYTQFKYSALKISKRTINHGDEVDVSYTVANIGNVAGAESTQIYVSDADSTVYRPSKELKEFTKVFLQPGEEKRVTVHLDTRAFAFYNTLINDWTVEDGVFHVLIGTNSRDIRLKGSLRIRPAENPDPIEDLRAIAPVYYTGRVSDVPDSQFEAVLGHSIPAREYSENHIFNMTNTFEDAKNTKWGKRIYKAVLSSAESSVSSSGEDAHHIAMTSVQTPIKSIIFASGGAITEEMGKAILMILNNKSVGKNIFKVLKEFLSSLKAVKNLLDSL